MEEKGLEHPQLLPQHTPLMMKVFVRGFSRKKKCFGSICYSSPIFYVTYIIIYVIFFLKALRVITNGSLKVGFEVLMAVNTKMVVFWVAVAPRYNPEVLNIT